MTNKISLASIGTGYNIGVVNANFSKIESALNDAVLYRTNPEGEENLMSQDLDMNGFALRNVDASALIDDLSPELGQAVSDAEDARDAAIIAQIAAEGSASNAASSAADALVSENAAFSSANSAAASAQAAAAAAASNLFSKTPNISSNYTIIANDDDGSMFICNTSGGAVDLSLPSILLAEDGERYGILREDADNTLTVIPSGTDTINGSAGNYTVANDTGTVLLLLADEASPNNWVVIPWTQVPSSLIAAVEALEDRVDAHDLDIGANTSAIADHETRISDLETITSGIKVVAKGVVSGAGVLSGGVGISGVSVLSTGKVRVTWTTPFSTTSYTVNPTAYAVSGTGTAYANIEAKTTSYVDVGTVNPSIGYLNAGFDIIACET